MEIKDRLKTVFSIDLRSIALFRIALGSVILLDLFFRAFDLHAFYTDDGVLTRSGWLEATHRLHWSVHAASGQWWFQALLFALAALFASALIVGYRTRVMTVLCWIMTVSVINRNGFILQGGDELLAVLTFWAMFLPLHARYSVDAALSAARRLDTNAYPGLDAAATSSVPLLHNSIEANRYFSVATVAVILQVLYLYFFTAILKTGDAWRVDMDAAFFAVSLQHFATPIGAFMRDFPAFLTFGTVFVIVLEFVGPLMALSPWFHLPLRLVSLACLYALHASFLLMLHIGLFPFIDFTALTLLIPGALWTWLATSKNRLKRAGISIYYDETCGFCRKTCLLLREFLLPSASQILPAQGHPEAFSLMQQHNTWVVQAVDGTLHTRWQALQYLFMQSPFFKPIGWLLKIPLLMKAGDRVYAQIASNRDHLGLWTERVLPYRSFRIKPRLLTQILAGFFLYVITYVNIAGIDDLNLKLPHHVEVAKRITRIDQKWNMFAPFPLTYSLYPVIVGNLRDGSEIDLLEANLKRSTPGSKDWQKPEWEVPDYIYPVFESYRWRKYLGRVGSQKSDVIRRGYGSYLCRNWNHPARARENQLATADINFVKLATNTEGTPKARSQRRAWEHWCYKEFAPK